MGDVNADIAVLTDAYSEHYHNKQGFLEQMAVDALSRAAADGTAAEYRPIVVRADGVLQVVPVQYSVEANNAAGVFAARAENYTDLANAATRIATANAALSAQFASAAAPMRSLREVQVVTVDNITGIDDGVRSYSFAFSDYPHAVIVQCQSGQWGSEHGVVSAKNGNGSLRIRCGTVEVVLYGRDLAAGFIDVDGVMHDLVRCEIYTS